jgi:hypothetical protein
MLRKPLAPKHLPKTSKTVVRERAIGAAPSATDAAPVLRSGLKVLGRGKAEPVHARMRAERRQQC